MFDKKAYQREYMAKRRAMGSGKKEAVSDNERRETGLGQDSAGVVQNQERGKEHPETVGVMPGSPVQSLSKQNLPVPVLAEPSCAPKSCEGGEARESITPKEYRRAECQSDSRGGQTLSSTDQKFEEDRPGWYIFGKEIKERDCWKCGKKFSTRLEMNKFCSPNCKNEYLDTAFTKLRSQ